MRKLNAFHTCDCFVSVSLSITSFVFDVGWFLRDMRTWFDSIGHPVLGYNEVVHEFRWRLPGRPLQAYFLGASCKES